MATFLKKLMFAGVALALTSASAAALPALNAPSTPATASDVVLAGSKGPRVKGYTERRGGYSYNQADSINTYGDSRSKYGNASSLRDPQLDKQSVAGPFDHGFFFDSATGPRGGDSPYMN
jgi:hypothetical protein